MSLYPGSYIPMNVLPPTQIPPINLPPINIQPPDFSGITGGIDEIKQAIQEWIISVTDQLAGIQGGIQSGIDGIGRGINTALTPDPTAWDGWNRAWGDLAKRFSELFTDVQYQGQQNQTGIGKLGLPQLVIAGVIGAVGLGMIEYMNTGLAFTLSTLILVGLFLMGDSGSKLSGALNDIRSKLGYR